MERTIDLIVIGGGATGAGIALDAALRGLSVVLFEQNDFGEGTSSRSTKLVHGGVRYLEAAIRHLDAEQWRLVREGLRERKRFLHNARHLAHPVALVTPLYRWYELPYVYAGLFLYDRISGRASLGRSRLLSARTARKLIPTLAPQGLKGAVRYYDGAFDDARMVIALVQSAEAAGAQVHNHHAVTRLLKDRAGQLTGVEVQDRLSDTLRRYHATAVINATGPFTDTIRRLDDPKAAPLIETSSGIHIVLPTRFLPTPKGMMIPRTSDGRLIFALPYRGRCLVGTTDRPAPLSEHPPVREEEITFLLEHLNHYLVHKATRKDILATFSGLRPLIASNAHGSTAELVRESVYLTSPSGLLTVAGGKWTAYRAMAEKAVDHLIRMHPALHHATPCTTHHHRIIGSVLPRDTVMSQLQADPQLAPLAEYLYARYGDQSSKIGQYIRAPDDLIPLLHDLPITRAEIRYTLHHEYVRKPLDFLVRRSGAGLIDRQAAYDLLPEVLSVMAETFGWDIPLTSRRKTEAKALLNASI